ncbi:MAG: hypothetical protein IID61_02615 [SAR324 cluster bacterium]|nr:hypothetical protein [SAR324 cluster bacterium]
MRRNLLVIDRTTQSNPIVRLLEREGYRCYQARGPLRVRDLLNQQQIDLILWNEEAGNPNLGLDLLRACSSRPAIPVVHLFPAGGNSMDLSDHPQVSASLPVASSETELTNVINDTLGGRQGSRPVALNSELAFRNVLTLLREQALTDDFELDHIEGGDIRRPVTSVNAAEREGLVHEPQNSAAERSPLRWLTRTLQKYT